MSTQAAIAEQAATTDSRFERMLLMFRDEVRSLRQPLPVEATAIVPHEAQPTAYGPAPRFTAGAATGPYGLKNDEQGGQTGFPSGNEGEK